MPRPPHITLRGVSVSLGGRPVLRDLTWTLRGGEHWAVLGPNGAGKSTFLRLLRGDLRPDPTTAGGRAGSCTWNVDGTEDASPLAIKPLARLVSAEQHRTYVREAWRIDGMGLILSGFTDSLLPSFSGAAQERAAARLARRLGAAPLLRMAVTSMSQGQLRLALLARAMITKPKLLLLDEAFDGLDQAARAVLRDAVNQAARTAAVVCTAHRENDLPACITHVLRLRGGGIESAGPAAAAGEKSASLFAGGGAAPSPVPLPFPPEISDRKGKSGPEGVCTLELTDVDVYVNRAKVLHGLNWRVLPGENWRLAGPNGSGKSTLLRLIAGLEQVALGGSLRWFGQEHPPLEKRRRETGYLSDLLHAAYTYDLTGLELAATGFEGSVGIWKPISRKNFARAKEWVDFLGLSAMGRTLVSRLSSGTARRFFLARALVGSPRLLLLDEPCSGLDAESRAQFLASLATVMNAGVQCLYVSHHDGDVPAGITHELRLDAGRIVHAGPAPLIFAPGDIL